MTPPYLIKKLKKGLVNGNHGEIDHSMYNSSGGFIGGEGIIDEQILDQNNQFAVRSPLTAPSN